MGSTHRAREIRYILAPVTREEVEAFLDLPIPRDVPPAIRRNALSRGCASGCFLAFGAMWSLMALAGMFIIPLPWRLLDELRLDIGSPATATGEVLSVERVGKRDRRARFSFVDSGGNARTGVCYHAPVMRDRHHRRRGPEPGREAQVEYLPGRPEVSRLKGWTVNRAGYFPLIFVPVLLIGPTILFVAASRRRRTLRLLRNGYAVKGRITAGRGATERKVSAPGCSFGVNRVHDAVIAYEAGGAEVEARFFAASRHERGVVGRARQSGEPVWVMYDPVRPERMLLAEALIATGGQAPGPEMDGTPGPPGGTDG
ncbi:MAG: hypothetical protein ACYS9X_07920 [Planctomycetota bacterium]|jgi:hypothetical protein